jgi:hypothetical protein
MNNRKRSITLAMLLILSLPMATILIKSAYAVDAVKYGFSWWDGASADFLVVTSSALMPGVRPPYHTNDTLVLNDYPWRDDNTLNVTFRVNNTQPLLGGPGNIVRVQFHIWEDPSLGAIFHYLDSTPQYEQWKTRILEKDTKGWARLIEFYLDEANFGIGIAPGNNATYTVTFGALALGKTLNYTGEVPEFIVTSAYQNSYAEDQSIYWYLGPPQLTVNVDIIPSPVNGNVTGLLFGTGCGHHYFNVTFTATDTFGILNYTISIAGPQQATDWGNTTKNWWTSYPTSYTNVTQWVDFLDGNYTVTVKVFDTMKVSASDSISFRYIHPQRPIGLSPTSGYAASETGIANAVSGLVNSTQTVYGNKVFGTNVTVSGYGFGASKTVKVTVYIPTYYSYNSTYHSFEVLVASTTTDASGNYTTWFIFPKAPMGTYNVTGVSATYTCATTFQVLPQIIYNPNSVIGPAVVNVEATGFPNANNSVVPGPNNWNRILILCNNKDTLLGIDSQVLEDWYIDANGTLQNVITGVLGGRRVHNGIVWPALQPGTYNLTLVLYTNDQVNQPLLYWNSPTWQSITTNYFEHTNTITVEETLSLLIDINAKLDYLKPIVERIDGNVVTINTTAGRIEAKVDQLSPVITRIDGNVVTLNTTLGNVQATLNQLSPVITRIDGNVVTLNTTLGQINTTMATVGPQLAAISPDIATIKTSVGTGLSGKVDSIQGNVTIVKTDVGDISTQVPSLTTPIYIAVVFSIIAAIAAIACAFLVYRKIA